MADSEHIVYDLIGANDVDAAYELEWLGYPPDEAASLDTLRHRQTNAPDLFFGAYISGTQRSLIGFVCSTLSPSPTLTHASMSTHVPQSSSSTSSVCIHSVCVSPAHRRQGVALGLLRAYLARLSLSPEVYARVLLLAHEDLVPLYEKAGFELVGPSGVVHGTRPWLEMRKLLSPGTQPPDVSGVMPVTEGQGLPPGIWEALQRASSSRARPTGKLIGAFAHGLQDVSSSSNSASPSGSSVSDTRSNSFDLLCPRSSCGSVILKRGAACLRERESVCLEPPERLGTALAHPALVPLPAPPETVAWWLVVPNAMVFENIGFSRPATGLPPSTSGKNLKLLLCAECDLGPLGWCEEGGSEFWLACSRVAYRD